MKCPRCGSELSTDAHRKYNLQMCYNCGYMEGRYFGGDAKKGFTNFEHMKTLNMNELAIFRIKLSDFEITVAGRKCFTIRTCPEFNVLVSHRFT